MTDIFNECLHECDIQDCFICSGGLASYRRILRLEADLLECLEYFKDRYDVVDGHYGEPRPNREMQLGTMLDQTLNAEAF